MAGTVAPPTVPRRRRDQQQPLFNPPSQPSQHPPDEFDAMLEADVEFGQHVAASQEPTGEHQEAEMEMEMESQTLPDPKRKRVSVAAPLLCVDCLRRIDFFDVCFRPTGICSTSSFDDYMQIKTARVNCDKTSNMEKKKEITKVGKGKPATKQKLKRD
jgi:hypothetical protein